MHLLSNLHVTDGEQSRATVMDGRSEGVSELCYALYARLRHIVALYRRFRGGFHSALRRIPQLNNSNSAVGLVAFLRHPT
jgi:hypothetical protein